MNILNDIWQFIIAPYIFIRDTRRYEKMKTLYHGNVFKASPYINHRLHKDNPKTIYQFNDGFHMFSLGTQRYMIERGWLKETHKNQYENDIVIEEWLEKYMKGFYYTRAWGNSRFNEGQDHYGYWHYEVHIADEKDAMTFKMMFWGI